MKIQLYFSDTKTFFMSGKFFSRYSPMLYLYYCYFKIMGKKVTKIKTINLSANIKTISKLRK